MNQIDIDEKEKHSVRWEYFNNIYDILTSKSNKYAFNIVYNGEGDENILKKYKVHIKRVSIKTN